MEKSGPLFLLRLNLRQTISRRRIHIPEAEITVVPSVPIGRHSSELMEFGSETL